MACTPENLPDTPEWRALTWDEKVAFAKYGNPRHFEEGDFIFHQGDECQGIYIVRSGLVSCRREDLEGHVVTMNLAKRNDILGYRPLLADEPHMTSAQVIEACNVCIYPSRDVKSNLLRNVGFGLALLRREAHELGQAEMRFQEAVTQHLRHRLLALLLEMKNDFGTKLVNGEILLEFPISRKEMASMIGVRIETLSREIRHLKDEGLVEFSGHRAWLKDVEAMEKEVSSRVSLH